MDETKGSRNRPSVNMIAAAASLFRLLADARRSRAGLEGIIRTRLRNVLLAARTVPHYQEIMRAVHYDPLKDFLGPEDLAVLPVTSKADVKTSPESFVQAKELHRLHRYFSDRTSGSTGTPLTVYRAPRERAIQIAKWLRVLILNGYRPTQKVLSFTSPGRLNEGRSVLQRLGVFGRKAVDYTLPPEVLVDQLLDYRPDVVYGVRTSILIVADELKRRAAPTPPIKLLIAGGEVVDAHTRQRARATFGVDITETYGTVEMGVMGYQPRGHDGLRLIEDCTLFEFLDDGGYPAKPGELARIVVTDLHGGLMPFIRYDQGDLATYSLRENGHGETIRVIDRIVGRQDDIAHLPDGRFLTYLDFYEILDVYAGIDHFRVRQLEPGGFVVELVTTRDYYNSIKQELSTKLQALSSLPLKFELRLVDCINPDMSGKRRILVSEVDKRSLAK